MTTPANSINESTTGITGFTGTAFVGTPVTQHAIQVGGATSSTLVSLAVATTGKVLQGNTGADPSFSTATYPSASGGTGKILFDNGTNFVESTPTFPASASATAGKIIISDGTNWIASTPTYPNTSGTSGKVVISDGTNNVYSTPTFPNASATTRKIIVSDGTNWVASTETYAVPGTSGNLLTSNGTNWTSAAPATSGTVTSVSGTTNQVSVATGTTTPVISLVGPYTPATYTAHGILVGEGTSSIVAMATGSAGQIVQSGGAAADPVYSTATYPAVATGTGTILRADGTNWVATTSTYPNTNAISTLLYASSANVMSALATATNGVLVTSNTSVPSILAGPGAAGKVLQSNTAAAPSYSTPTYPSASGTSRTILVSDGTNNVYSTETWAVPGTSGNILTSNGTNWTSATPTPVWLTASGTLTNAQVKALHATPVQLIAAPGAGKIINVVQMTGKLAYGGTNVFTAAASQSIQAYYGTVISIANILNNAGVIAAASQYSVQGGQYNSSAYASIANVAVNAYNPIVTEITGNAANDNTVPWFIVYYIVTI